VKSIEKNHITAMSNQETPQQATSATTAEHNSGSLVSFLKSLVGFNGDIASVTAPSWILSPTSLTEYSAYWYEPGTFLAMSKEEDPEKRALAVLKWFLATLKAQYTSRNEKMGSEKKPLNPVLGELFLGTWNEQDGSVTELFSEQVSHHPPITAYAIRNAKNGILLNGHNGQKASISFPNLTIRQIGYSVLTLERFHNETYLITLPFIRIEGVYFGAPYIELGEHTYIHSSSGYTSKIDYSGKGYLSGKKNSFKATVSKNGTVLHTVSGVWTDKSVIGDGEKPKQTRPFLDAKHIPFANINVAPINKQGEWESRKIWEKVAAAIRAGDMDAASHEKSKIENWQRDMRKKEQAETKSWQRKFFRLEQTGPEFERLASEIKFKSDPSWLFTGDK